MLLKEQNTVQCKVQLLAMIFSVDDRHAKIKTKKKKTIHKVIILFHAEVCLSLVSSKAKNLFLKRFDVIFITSTV